ncbi:rtcB domain protein [Shigella boydii 965-58]|nr:rtcB domain protein [Shigella boydii 965-58]
MNYELLTTENAPVKMWTKGVPVEADARQQLINTAKMPFIFKHIAVMPDVHLGKGSTIGSVIPTKGAIIPAAVGVDIGCGMNALRTALTAADLPENLAKRSCWLSPSSSEYQPISFLPAAHWEMRVVFP